MWDAGDSEYADTRSSPASTPDTVPLRVFFYPCIDVFQQPSRARAGGLAHGHSGKEPWVQFAAVVPALI